MICIRLILNEQYFVENIKIPINPYFIFIVIKHYKNDIDACHAKKISCNEVIKLGTFKILRNLFLYIYLLASVVHKYYYRTNSNCIHIYSKQWKSLFSVTTHNDNPFSYFCPCTYTLCIYTNYLGFFDERNQIECNLSSIHLSILSTSIYCVSTVCQVLFWKVETKGTKKAPACMSFNIYIVYQMVVSAMKKVSESEWKWDE